MDIVLRNLLRSSRTANRFRCFTFYERVWSHPFHIFNRYASGSKFLFIIPQRRHYTQLTRCWRSIFRRNNNIRYTPCNRHTHGNNGWYTFRRCYQYTRTWCCSTNFHRYNRNHRFHNCNCLRHCISIGCCRNYYYSRTA